ncbi:MAG: dihydrolipoyl dehydrogenase, partial [Nitrospiraceae bacterium]
EITRVDFRAVMDRMKNAVSSGRDRIKTAIEETENIDFYNKQCHFVDDHTFEAGDKKIRGKKIFIASGARPVIPPLKGLENVPYLTNESVLGLEKKPEKMIIIGGGYIGLEYAHFFSALDTKVIMITRSARLLPSEEPEISELLKNELGKRVEIRTGTTEEVKQFDGGYVVLVRGAGTGQTKKISAEAVMVATGRKSNADLLKIENAGIETDKNNFIKVDGHLQASRKHIWAVGDANGMAMFTHAGDKQAEIAWHNATHRKKIRMDFQSVPHAIFTHPQIASIGLTEEKARKSHDVLVGRAKYSDTVMGEAMMEQEGFAKAVVEKNSGRILGFHIIGPHAAMLIQEVVNAVINKKDIRSITGCMHIFPALSNLIPETLGNLE